MSKQRPTGSDRRQTIVEGGLAILREDGLAGFTQPRVAARLGLRQSHITYYFPTRAALLAAVLTLAVEQQVATAERVVGASETLEAALDGAARAILFHPNTRVLVALCQASDEAPEIRAIFNTLAAGVTQSLAQLLKQLGFPASRARVDLLHGLVVGLSILALATGREDSRERTMAVLTEALKLFSIPEAPTGAEPA